MWQAVDTSLTKLKISYESPSGFAAGSLTRVLIAWIAGHANSEGEVLLEPELFTNTCMRGRPKGDTSLLHTEIERLSRLKVSISLQVGGESLSMTTGSLIRFVDERETFNSKSGGESLGLTTERQFALPLHLVFDETLNALFAESLRHVPYPVIRMCRTGSLSLDLAYLIMWQLFGRESDVLIAPKELARMLNAPVTKYLRPTLEAVMQTIGMVYPGFPVYIKPRLTQGWDLAVRPSLLGPPELG